jgi:hypothetical protein
MRRNSVNAIPLFTNPYASCSNTYDTRGPVKCSGCFEAAGKRFAPCKALFFACSSTAPLHATHDVQNGVMHHVVITAMV